MTICVMGGAGFIGRRVVRLLAGMDQEGPCCTTLLHGSAVKTD
ncbi:hypothetical protein [Muricoccus pecuniae]|uniref:Nucleoside-diphosphate-sugar epimerase n=1 Tax=Muricoccus pecuniae TaxID=693023 RepID=A0A840YMI7_9PROT|nr:hypothetical protein [Roseomonas pecuniae]MBB5696243.1 nucleoside-diphosphate-sugar epimerase [Roseomonas pecuniae]